MFISSGSAKPLARLTLVALLTAITACSGESANEEATKDAAYKSNELELSEEDIEDLDEAQEALKALSRITGGNSGSAAPLMNELSAQVTEMADLMETVDSKSKAKSVARKINALNTQMDETQAKLDALPQEDVAAAGLHHMAPMLQAATRITATIQKLQTEKPEVYETLLNEVDELPAP